MAKKNDVENCEYERAPAKRSMAAPAGFDAAWASLGTLARALCALGEKQFAEKREAVGADAERIDRIASRTVVVGMTMMPDEVRLFDRRGLSPLATGLRCQWAIGDPAFRAAATRVWSHAPAARSLEQLGTMAAMWGLCDDNIRERILVVIRVVAAGTRRLTMLERETIELFAGDGYADRR
jgi:hypothetical protein